MDESHASRHSCASVPFALTSRKCLQDGKTRESLTESWSECFYSHFCSLPSAVCRALVNAAMASPDAPDQPSLLWRTGSAFITGATGFLCRTFLVGLNRLELNGYDKFLQLVDERADVNGRTRGLITGKKSFKSIYSQIC